MRFFIMLNIILKKYLHADCYFLYLNKKAVSGEFWLNRQAIKWKKGGDELRG